MDEEASLHCLRFGGALTLRCVDVMHGQLLNALRAHEAVTVDCSQATEIDISFIQLLLAARRTARDWGKTLILAAPAHGPLREALIRGGFLSTLDTQITKDTSFWNEGSAA